jgi:hypothetical protein
MSQQTRPGASVVTVTQSDTADIDKRNGEYPRALWVGGAGNVKLTTPDGVDAVFEGVAAGTLLPVQTRRVWDNGTTVTAAIVGIY